MNRTRRRQRNKRGLAHKLATAYKTANPDASAYQVRDHVGRVMKEKHGFAVDPFTLLMWVMAAIRLFEAIRERRNA